MIASSPQSPVVLRSGPHSLYHGYCCLLLAEPASRRSSEGFGLGGWRWGVVGAHDENRVLCMRRVECLPLSVLRFVLNPPS